MTSLRSSTRWPWTVGFLLAAVLVSLWLAHETDPARIRHDGAQYASVARNILSGDGLTSDVAYYDLQHRSGGFPVPMTDWPPGYPASVAVLMLFGTDAATALLLINYLAVFVCGFVIYRCSAEIGTSPLVATAATATWWLFVPAWALARTGGATFPFIMATLVGYLCFLRLKRGGVWLHVAGLAAAYAFSLRFVGLFFIAALALMAGIELLRSRNRAALLDTVRMLYLPVLAVALILLRNKMLVGSWFSRPLGYPEPSPGLFRSLAWSLGQLAGVERVDVASGSPIAWAVLLGLVMAGCIVALVTMRRIRGDLSALSRHPLLYPAAMIFGLGAISLLRGNSYFAPRYLVPVVPFAILSVVWVFGQLPRPGIATIRWILPAAALACLSGQLHVASRELPFDPNLDEAHAIRRGLAAQVGDRSVADHLRTTIDRQHPLFSSDPHTLSLILERPMLGVAIANYSRIRLDADAARELLDRFGVHYVLMLPLQFDVEQPFNRNLTLFADLAQGRTPPWLRCLYRNEALTLYGVVDAAGGAPVPPWPDDGRGGCD